MLHYHRGDIDVSKPHLSYPFAFGLTPSNYYFNINNRYSYAKTLLPTKQEMIITISRDN